LVASPVLVALFHLRRIAFRTALACHASSPSVIIVFHNLTSFDASAAGAYWGRIGCPHVEWQPVVATQQITLSGTDIAMLLVADERSTFKCFQQASRTRTEFLKSNLGGFQNRSSLRLPGPFGLIQLASAKIEMGAAELHLALEHRRQSYHRRDHLSSLADAALYTFGAGHISLASFNSSCLHHNRCPKGVNGSQKPECAP
jgi:hypothetical protein